MKKLAVLLYGVGCYVVFLGTFVYAIGFLGNLAVPRTIHGEPRTSLPLAVGIDLALLGLFALQHSVMARPAFKRWWMRWVPLPVERSTYVLASSLALILLFWQWQPFGSTIWDVQHPSGRAAILALYIGGWLTVLVSTFLIHHFDLFGLRQTWTYARGRQPEPLPFKTPGPYRWVRHPLYVGWLLVFWSNPTMSAAHLLFALATTAYILIAIQFEERDLMRFHPEYALYRTRVPMLIPGWGRGAGAAPGLQVRGALVPDAAGAPPVSAPQGAAPQGAHQAAQSLRTLATTTPNRL